MCGAPLTTSTTGPQDEQGGPRIEKPQFPEDSGTSGSHGFPPPPRPGEGYAGFGHKKPFPLYPLDSSKAGHQYHSAPWVAQRDDPMAIASLILSISSFFFFYLVGAILGLIFGYISLSNIRESEGRLKGEQLARAGIILGWVNIGLFFAIFLTSFILIISMF